MTDGFQTGSSLLEFAKTLPIVISVLSLCVSVIGITYVHRNFSDTRRNSEVTTLFDIIQRYDSKLDDIKKSDDKDAILKASFALLNYLEIICYIFNHGRATPMILDQIKAIASDCIMILREHIDFDGLLDRIDTGFGSFSEIRTFTKNNSSLLETKRLLARGTPFQKSENLCDR